MVLIWRSLFCYFACYIFNNQQKYHLISHAPITNKEANETIETTMKDATNFNSETYETHVIIVLKNIYEIDLKIWGRASITDNTNTNLKTVRLLKYLMSDAEITNLILTWRVW